MASVARARATPEAMLHGVAPSPGDARRKTLQPELWLGVEFRHLTALQAVAEESSFNRAASRLGYTQSAISQQIAALERIVGVKLVERRGGPLPVHLTSAGELLVEHAAAIGARLGAAFADLSAMRDGARGRVQVGSVQGLGATLLPQALLDFRRALPDVEVEILEFASDRHLVCLLERGDLDVALLHTPLLPGPFRSEVIFSDDYVLIAATERRDVPTDATIEHLAGLPLVAFRSSRCCETLFAYLRAHEIEPEVVVRADDARTVHGLVAAGFGFALMPRLETDPNDVRVRILEVSGLPRRTVAACWHADRSQGEMAERFVRSVVAAAQRSRTKTDRTRLAVQSDA